MPIKGLTDRGLAFPEIGQIRKGAPKGDRAPGKDLTYFRVEFDEREVKAAEQFRQVYGDQPTAIRIILPFNDLSRMWDAWLEAYTAGRMIARSDGEWVQYQINGQTGEILVMNGKDTKTGEPVAHPRDDVAGYDFKKNAIKYKASGRLKVIIPELGRAAYLTVLTTSKHDIANISAQLAAFAEINRGQIAGIPFILRRKPKKISMPGQTPGQRVRVVKWMLSIEADPDWVKAKLGELNTAALPAGVVHALPPGPVDDEGFEQVEGEIEDDELDTTGFEVPYQAEPPQPPDQDDEPEAPAAQAVDYPAELAVVVNSQGEPYVSLPTEKLSHMLNSVTKAAKAPKDDEHAGQLAMKADAIKQIIALRSQARLL